MAKYDVVVIGGGHNGLVAANYLADAGLRGIVIERRGVLGGLASSEELWPGFKIPTGAYVLSLFKRRIIEELGLGKMGLRVYLKEPGLFLPLPGGRSLTIWPDVKATVREVERYSKRDASSYVKWVSFWDAFTSLIEPLLYTQPPSLMDILDEARRISPLLGVFRDLAERFVEDFAYAITASAARMLDDYFESEEVKAALVEDGVVGTFAGPYTPGTAYVLAHHVMGEVNGVKGAWGYVEGGIGRLSELLAERARGRGVDIMLGVGVRRIIVRDSSVKGVELDDGRVIEAGYVLSSADVKTTFLKLIDPDAVDGDFRRRISNIESTGVSAKIVGVLEGLPKVGVKDSDPLIGYRASMLIMPSVDYVERAYRDALNGSYSREPWISINVPTTYDRSITTGDYHVFSMFIQYVPRSIKLDESVRESIRDAVYSVVEEYIPGFRKSVVRDMLITPHDYESAYGTVGGNIFHIDMRLDQLFTSRPMPGLSRYRTPIRGLYLCGSDAHPGGGVTGLPGRNAAMALLEDLGKVKRAGVNIADALLAAVKVLKALGG